MKANLDSAEAARLLIPLLNKEIESKFTSLLETKHLYQRVTIDGEGVIGRLRAQVIPAYQSGFDEMTRSVPEMPFTPALNVVRVMPQDALGQVPLVLLLKNITLFCQQPKCDRREAFRPIWYMDLAQKLRPLTPSQVRRLPLPGSFQVFLLVYQCQHCEGRPETLIVRRSGWQLSLDGPIPRGFCGSRVLHSEERGSSLPGCDNCKRSGEDTGWLVLSTHIHRTVWKTNCRNR
jgi:hypothetical protein